MSGSQFQKVGLETAKLRSIGGAMIFAVGALRIQKCGVIFRGLAS